MGTCVGGWHPSNPAGLCPRAVPSEGNKNPYFNNYVLNHIPSRITHEHRNKAWLHLQRLTTFRLATFRSNLIQLKATLCDNTASVSQTSVHVHDFKAHDHCPAVTEWAI